MSKRLVCSLAVVLALSMVPALAVPCFTPGNVFVVGERATGAGPSSLIFEFTPDGALVRTFDPGSGLKDLAFRDKFHLYASGSGGPLSEFNPDGTLTRSLAVPGHGVGVGYDGHVYAAQRGGNIVREVDTWQPALTQVGSIATQGVSGNNCFDAIAPSNGLIYVPHYGDNVVHAYDRSGTLVHSGAATAPHSIAISPDETQISALGGSVHQYDTALNPTGSWTHSGRMFINSGEDNRLYIGTYGPLAYSRNADGSDHQVVASGSVFTVGGSDYRAISAQPAPGSNWHMLVSVSRWAGDPSDPSDTTPWYAYDGGAVFEFDETGSLLRVLNESSGAYARGMGSINNRYVAVNHNGLKVLDTVSGAYVATGGGCDGVNVGNNGLIYAAVRGSKLVREYQFDTTAQTLTLLRTLPVQAPGYSPLEPYADTIDVAANDEFFYVAYYPNTIQQYRLSDGGFVDEWTGTGTMAHSVTIDPRTGNLVARGTGGNLHLFDPDTLALISQAAWGDYTTFLGYGPDDLLYSGGAITGGTYQSCGQIRVGTPGQASFVYVGPDEFIYNGRHYWATDVAFTYVPEPTTLSLLALGGLALVRRRRRS